MQKPEYSYLDLCVLQQLRGHVLSPEPALVFDAGIEVVLWVNAAGAEFFGGDGVVELLSSRPSPSQPFIQQLRFAYEQLRENETLSRGFRVVRGLRSELIQCELSMITLPHGEKALLLKCQDEKLLRTLKEYEIADNAVNSLNGFADAAAIIDDYTLTIAATRSFSDIDLSVDDLQVLVSDLRDQDDRLVKRRINALDKSEFAAGIARLSNNPGRNLLVLARTGSGGVNEPIPSTSVGVFSSKDDIVEEPILPETDMISDGDSHPLDEPVLQFGDEAKADEPEELIEEETSVEELTEPEADKPDEVVAEAEEPDIEIIDNEETKPLNEDVTQEDASVTGDIEQTDEVDEPPFTFDDTANATRFAWTIDENQIFKSVSPELAEIVGPNAADVVGRRWQDVAAVFGFDENGIIGGLLSKQDTWSGKSVMWPVQGTDLQVPIDLAALPAFSSEREFEGFRGFGVIRTADAILDQDATGLALTAARTKGWVGKRAPTSLLDNEKTDDVSIRQILTQEDEFVPEEKPDNVFHLTPGHPQATKEDQPVQPAQPERENLTDHENRAFDKIGKSLRETSDSEWIIGREEEAGVPETVVSDDEKNSNNDLSNSDLANDNSADDDLINGELEKVRDLDIPALVYQADECLFVNEEMLDITGYDSLSEIVDAGGIDVLLESNFDKGQSELEEGSNDAFHLVLASGEQLSGQMTLRSIAWRGEKALLLTFSPHLEEKTPGDALLTEPTAPAAHDEMPAIEISQVSQLQNILNTATDGIIVVDNMGTIESINAPAEALFGIEHSGVSNKSIETLFAVESHDAIASIIVALTSDTDEPKDPVGSVLNDGLELIGREANGGFIPLLVTFGKMGTSKKLCAVIRDMSAWKKAEEDLIQARRQAELASEHKSEFLARVSHEIRTPLNAIIGFSDVMIEERFGAIENERYREYLRDINRSGVHVLDLINDLLDLSKIESGKMDLSFEAVDLNKIVSETVALMQPQANSQRIIIRTSLSRAVPKVVADARAMRQIIMNLVSNAIKFSQRNGQVIVSTVYESNGEVALRIRDTGIGMSESELKDAMQPFHQIPGTGRDRRGEGTGLGLPLTKALVDANRAYFDLESATDKGTIAHVQFPTQRVLAD
ncbi:MAG: histidine kinase dimerization/phospho-acceptor domain-containing protein [Rhizobiaceae bacterium]